MTRSLSNQFANGWQPNFTTTYPESPNHPYRGVFLNQDYPRWDPPYYSVGAPSPQTIGGYVSNFIGWAGTGVQYRYTTAQQTGVVFRQAGATAVAKAEFAQSYNAQPTTARLGCL